MTTLSLRSQADIEFMVSRRNIHNILKAALETELDTTLFDWTFYMASRFDVWYGRALNNEYYNSKNARLQALKPWLEKHGLDALLILIMAAVLVPTKMGKQTCTYQQAVGYLAPHMPHEDPFDQAKTAAELLAVGASNEFIYGIEPQGAGVMTLVRVFITPDFERALEPAVDWINNTGFNPPLVEPPIPVNNRNCGYHTFDEPLLLGKFTQHNKPLDLSTINTLNSIQWVLDQDVLKEEDTVPKDFNYSSQQTREEYLRECGHIHTLLGEMPFWLAWQYDSRGRMYSHGYHVNFQSYEYRKACLSFNKYEYLT